MFAFLLQTALHGLGHASGVYFDLTESIDLSLSCAGLNAKQTVQGIKT